MNINNKKNKLNIDLNKLIIKNQYVRFTLVSATNINNKKIMDIAIALSHIAAGTTCIGMGLAGIGIGMVFSSVMKGISRNPSVESALLKNALIGCALIESMGLFSLIIALLILFQ